MNEKRLVYIVEGACEKALIDSLKKNPALIKSGKTMIFNSGSARSLPPL